MSKELLEVEILLKSFECEAVVFEQNAKFLVTRKNLIFEDGECLQYEEISPIVSVEGLYRRYLYNGDQINKQKKEIENLIESSFPPTFLKEGGYWSVKLFNPWTDDEKIAEMLLALGIAIGKFRLERFGESPFIVILY